VTAADAVFIDPLVPEAQAAFWSQCDPLVAGRTATVLTTIHWHERSRAAIAERYGAAVTGPLPDGVRSLVFEAADETFFWLPEPQALVVGDRILGRPGGGLRLCPESWMAGLAVPLTQAQLKGILAPALERPVQRVLTSHGDPVLSGGAAALERILR
jgi:hypothetical protein